MAVQIIRYISPIGSPFLGITTDGELSGQFPTSTVTLHDLLRLPAEEFREVIEQASKHKPEYEIGTLLAPVDGETEVWAAGVTYKRSEEARKEESDTPDIYARVYKAERPEIFFKATARRAVGHEGTVAIREDSTWDVPEPELAVVVNSRGEIVGYTIGNDMSSRSIEGENPLYLPQAKMYAGSCALGPGITPAWEIEDPYNLTMRMKIERGGKTCWEGETSTKELHRKLEELVGYLYREDIFPDGAILCTGTALVPDQPFTLQEGDVVSITIDGLGTLRNEVVRGKKAFKRASVREREL